MSKNEISVEVVEIVNRLRSFELTDREADYLINTVNLRRRLANRIIITQTAEQRIAELRGEADAKQTDN